MSVYESRRLEIDLDAPVFPVSLADFESYWAALEAVDRFGHGKLAEQGIEAIWHYEDKHWITPQ